MLEYQISKFARDCLEKQKLSPPAKILDAPCGYGRHAHWLAELGHNVYAIDIDSKRVKYARNTAPPKLRPINWIVGDIEKPTFGHTTTRSEEHTSELQSLMRISYAVFCLKKKQTY